MSNALTTRLAAQLRATNYTVARINKLLSTTSNLDATLLTVGYTLHLLHTLLSRLTTAQLSLAAAALISRIHKTSALAPGEAILLTPSPTSRLIRTQHASRALAALIDDYRMFLRLKGLPAIWTWGAATWHNPPEDKLLKGIVWSQVLGNALFQYLENGAYLATKGVVAMAPEEIARRFVWSARFWCLHVSLEFVRLARTRVLRRRAGLVSGGEEKEDKLVAVKEEAKWWQDVYVNAAWMPLTLHYGVGSFVGEGTIALLSLFAGSYNLKRAWANTA